MISDTELFAQLPFVLDRTDFGFLGQRYQGKVRDSYSRGEQRYLIVSDRLSCFDVVLTTIPFKGQVLNQLAAQWFKLSKDIVVNHVLDIPDPNVMLVKQCEILPIEVVVRGYLAGSALRDYVAGRDVSGVRLPPGIKPYGRLEKPILTPSTKAALGSHDQPISEADILSARLVEPRLWQEVREKALQLFALGTERARERGLILADTKYEFGLCQGTLTLADEIHTLDSSRYWTSSSYQRNLSKDEPPEMLDKEPTRQWLLAQGFKGEGPIPEFTSAHRVEIAKHYIRAFEQISGLDFVAGVGDVSARLERIMRSYSAAAAASQPK